MHLKSPLNQSDSRPILPIQTLFEYSGVERYIQMHEKFRVSNDQEILLSHLLLDQELSIIDIKKKQIIDIEQNRCKEESKDINIKYLCTDPTKIFFYKRQYKKYTQLNDFIFGRQGWGRNINCLRFSSNLISRLHTKIIYNNIVSKNSSNKLLDLITNIINQEAHFSSILRKISNQIWNKIIEYAAQRQKYTIKDCGSRNGTYLMDCSYHQIILEQGGSYEFENQDYLIRINRLIYDSGRNIKEMLRQFQQNWAKNQFYIHLNSLKIINEHNLDDSQGLMSVLYFQIEFHGGNKAVFWVIEKIEQQAKEQFYCIGQGQIIDIMNDHNGMTYEFGRHGEIRFISGSWKIAPIYQEERLWTKLIVERQYELNPHKRYRIRLGHFNIIDLTFHSYL